MVNIVNSTSKFGVKLDGMNTRVKHPHIKNRFRTEFIGFAAPIGGTSLTLDAKSCDFPKPSFEKKTISTYNGDVNYAGKMTWGDISMSVYNSIDNMSYRELLRQWQLQKNLANQATATVAQNYKFITNVYHLGGEHEVFARWQLEGCWIQNVTFDSGEYGAHDPMMINLTITPDNCLFFDENDVLVTAEESLTTMLTKTLATA